MEWHDAASADLVPDGRPYLVRVGTRHVLLVRHAGAVVATEPLCPHKFTALEDGELTDGCLVCPSHDAHFQLPHGTPRSGDEWAGPLHTFPCRIVDGRVQVAL